MKRLLLLTFTLMFSLVSGFPLPAFAQAPAKEIPVLVDGLPVAFDVKPVIQNQRTFPAIDNHRGRLPDKSRQMPLHAKKPWPESLFAVADI